MNEYCKSVTSSVQFCPLYCPIMWHIQQLRLSLYCKRQNQQQKGNLAAQAKRYFKRSKDKERRCAPSTKKNKGGRRDFKPSLELLSGARTKFV